MSFFSTFKPSQLAVAISACVGVSFAHSAGLERSTQSVDFLFEDGNYAEVGYAYVEPSLSGKDALGNKVDNMLDDYNMASATVKVAPSENTGLALTYTQPWGVDTTYPAGNMFNNDLGTTEAHLESNAIGLIASGKPSGSHVTLYGGVEYQQIGGYVRAATPVGLETASSAIPAIQEAVIAKATPLVTQQVIQGYVAAGALPSAEAFTGLATLAQTNPAALTAEQAGLLSSISDTIRQEVTNIASTEVPNQVKELALSPTYYQLDFEDESTVVPMVGVAYEKPEIALRAGVTYRAPAKFKVKGVETVTVPADPSSNVSDYPGNTKVEFPQSVSFDFQTGLSEKYKLLGMVNARWVDWSEFDVAPPFYGLANNGEPLAYYPKDQYSVEVALGKQFTPKFSAEIRTSYDSGTGTPLSILGPYDAVTGIAVGAKYAVSDQLDVSGGVQYAMIEGGEVKDNDGNTVLTIDDGDGYAVGMKMGYHF